MGLHGLEASTIEKFTYQYFKSRKVFSVGGSTQLMTGTAASAGGALPEMQSTVSVNPMYASTAFSGERGADGQPVRCSSCLPPNAQLEIEMIAVKA